MSLEFFIAWGLLGATFKNSFQLIAFHSDFESVFSKRSFHLRCSVVVCGWSVVSLLLILVQVYNTLFTSSVVRSTSWRCIAGGVRDARCSAALLASMLSMRIGLCVCRFGVASVGTVPSAADRSLYNTRARKY